MKIVENAVLAISMNSRIEGPLKLDGELFRLFLSSPEDPLPGFEGPIPGLRGRCKDHPRYGRWMYAFTRFYKPDIALEIGTNAGGTAVGIARALAENGKGRLICVDNGEGRPRAFPDTARQNILLTKLDSGRLEMICGDSQIELSGLAVRFKGSVDLCLIDAAHTFEAAFADMEKVLPMMKRRGFIMVHDIDPDLDLGLEASAEHKHPVFEAFNKIVEEHGFEWCILKFIRKHLGIIRV